MANPAKKLISSLIDYGEVIATLHSDAKTQTREERQKKLETIHKYAISSIPVILKDFEHVQLPTFFPKEAIPKILDKIQATLGEFKELYTDKAFDYDLLVKEINECKSRINTSSSSSLQRHSESLTGDTTQLKGSTSDYPEREEDKKGKSIIDNPLKESITSSSGLQHHSESPTGDSTQLEGSTSVNTQLHRFDRFTAAEKKCLFCFCLFPEEVEVKKREPIHLWIAMDLVANALEGAEMLVNLVAEGSIMRNIQNKRSSNGYKINQNARSLIMDVMMSISFAKDVRHKKAFTVINQKQPQQQKQPSHQHHQQQQQQPLTWPQPKKLLKSQSSLVGKNKDVVGELGTFVLNISDQDTLQATTLKQIFKMKNNIKVLHLGNWQHNSKKSIVVEVETLKGMMKFVGEVTLLSLEGMSGVVELPDFIYKLEKLKVLDLRGCPNLESLSEGIESLKQLRHLDLSECHLLDYIPKGIASLSELRELKGFVINPEDSQVGNVNRNGHGNKKKKYTTLSASFSELKALEKLIKLSIRTRRNFPTSDDFDTLCAMKKLEILKISWLWNSSEDFNESAPGRFPPSLKKLELQAAPENTMLQLLRLISKDAQSCLEKLYIRGGRISELGMKMKLDVEMKLDVQMKLDVKMYQIHHVQTVRLSYLANLHIDWDEFRTIFPKVTRLEVLQCPNLVFFPCDENGIWKKNKPANMVS